MARRGSGPGVGCAGPRELISANLDGEASQHECAELAAHLAVCGECREYAAVAASLHRSWRVGPAPAVPDLSEAILARTHPSARPDVAPVRRPDRAGMLRAALAAVAAVQLVIAGPELLRHSDAPGTLTAIHHLNAWAVAFAVGLLVAAVQPWRARGLLPLATALGLVMALTIVLDLVNQHVITMPSTAHAIEAAGLGLLWALARTEHRGERPWPSWRRGGRRRRRATDERAPGQPRMSLVKSDHDAA